MHAVFKALQNDHNTLMRSDYVLSDVDKFELENLQYAVSSHTSKLKELRSDMERLRANAATGRVAGIALMSLEAMHN